MGEFFKFIGGSIDSIFGGWRGRLALITLSTALALLGLWGRERQYGLPVVLAFYDMYDRWRWWNSIIPLTAISAILMILNHWKKPPVNPQPPDRREI